MSTTMIEQGWAALRAGDASAARDAFERALKEAASGAALEGLGHALYLQRDYPGSIASAQRPSDLCGSARQGSATRRQPHRHTVPPPAARSRRQALACRAGSQSRAVRRKPPLLAGYYAYWSGLPMEGRFET
jgi:hypothetical protein